MTTRDEALKSLAKANKVRMRRARLDNELKENPALLVELLRDPPTWLAGEKIGRLLRRFPRVGPRKASQEFLRGTYEPDGLVSSHPITFEIAERRVVGDLSPRELEHIIVILERKIAKKRKPRGELSGPMKAVHDETEIAYEYLSDAPVPRPDVHAEALPWLDGKQVGGRLERLRREHRAEYIQGKGWKRKAAA